MENRCKSVMGEDYGEKLKKTKKAVDKFLPSC